MKVIVLVTFFIGCFAHGFSQNFSGQWKGEFLDKSTSYSGWGGDKCEYVLDLECNGSKVTGYSYTYFTDQGARFYTICRLVGTLDKKKKFIEVTEVERTKTNVPANIRNCFQVHRLTYSNINDSENLSGSWAPAPDQSGSCGFGLTSLNRRSLKKSFPNFNNASVEKNTKKTIAKAPVTKPKPPVTASVVTKPVVKPKPVITVAPKQNEVVLKSNKLNVSPEEATIRTPSQQVTNAPLSFEKRNTNVLKTLEVENESIKIDLYDNGEIDGDSISVYYNNKLVLGKKRLTEKAITLTLPVANNNEVNELVMYAENLGTIPPNTALMVVMDGTKRYEVRITSDLQKSGTIRFVHKPKAN